MPHVLRNRWAPRLTMLWSVMAGRGCTTPLFPSPDDILLTNDAVDSLVTDSLPELFDHSFAHQAYPPQTFTNLALSRPVQFTFVIFDVRFVLFVR